jgi:hypothetical protein
VVEGRECCWSAACDVARGSHFCESERVEGFPEDRSISRAGGCGVTRGSHRGIAVLGRAQTTVGSPVDGDFHAALAGAVHIETDGERLEISCFAACADLATVTSSQSAEAPYQNQNDQQQQKTDGRLPLVIFLILNGRECRAAIN